MSYGSQTSVYQVCPPLQLSTITESLCIQCIGFHGHNTTAVTASREGAHRDQLGLRPHHFSALSQYLTILKEHSSVYTMNLHVECESV